MHLSQKMKSGIIVIVVLIAIGLAVWGIASIEKGKTETFRLDDTRETASGCLPPGGLVETWNPLSKACCSGSFALCDGEECVCA